MQWISHLSAIYNGKCSGAVESGLSGGSLTERLQELKDLYDRGLISEDEYEMSRQRALDGN